MLKIYTDKAREKKKESDKQKRKEQQQQQQEEVTDFSVDVHIIFCVSSFFCQP